MLLNIFYLYEVIYIRFAKRIMVIFVDFKKIPQPGSLPAFVIICWNYSH